MLGDHDSLVNALRLKLGKKHKQVGELEQVIAVFVLGFVSILYCALKKIISLISNIWK